MGLITETNAQYYSGQQIFPNLAGVTINPTFNCNFRVDVISAFDELGIQVNSKSNYTIYIDANPIDEDLSYVSDPYNNIITLNGSYGPTTSIYIELKEPAIAKNYGGYEYTTLDNVINNFLVAYVGEDKLISKIKRTDVMFHAKRGLQEFSYDTLKSIKSQELTIPPSLGVVMPQDYVNYVRCSWSDGNGVQHIIYPVNNLTTSPLDLPIQDESGIPTQDAFSNNLQAEQSLTEERWNSANDSDISGSYTDQMYNEGVYDFGWEKLAYGQRYGLDPQTSQSNGWFQINEREGKFTFSSNLVGKLIVLEYISDGLAYDADSKIPKMAEDALYAHINHSILSTKPNVPEYIVLRYKRERSAKLRNAKIRLSNIKLSEFAQVFRGKSKWIKH